MRRFASLWLPRWPTDRWRRNRPVEGPLALIAAAQGGLRLTAVDGAAAREGLAPGMTLADARALVLELFVAAADPAADAAALDQLVIWATRYTPWAAMDGGDGVVLDITGCAHLCGGEAALLEDACRRLGRAGITARAAIAETPAAAWAWARFRREDKARPIVPEGALGDHLAPLPVAALRIPDELAASLARVGLRRIEDLLRLPRAPLVARYGEIVTHRLDRLLGRAAEPIAPRAAPLAFIVRHAFAEPIQRREDFTVATERLLGELCVTLAKAGRGARRLVLAFFRVDATAQRIAVGTSAPSLDPRHLLRLFDEKFTTIDAGFGVEAMVVEAVASDLFAGEQAGFGDAGAGAGFVELVDRLRGRAGLRAVRELAAGDTHLPERASRTRPAELERVGRHRVAAMAARPIMLFDRPELLDMEAGAPPFRFRWRGRFYEADRLEGPERIEPEWWRRQESEGARRDYYRIEAHDGRRFWIFFQGGERQRWYLHGLFA
jgi:protein ImuB